ncbi:cytochrome P450 [Aspergillus karnatakaensis]|uniref:cytochrome P450 n=1 Tax=Aspergillus karnatakaensis TaxID=1810916 RepID=UPI003CCE49F3
METPTQLLTLAVIIIVSFFVYPWLTSAIANPIRLPLPPGHKPIPLIGNLHQFRGQDPWELLDKLQNEHGPILAVKLGGIQHSTANALGEWVSDKAEHTCAGAEQPQVKIQHRLLKLLLSNRSTLAYRGLQDLESKQAVRDLLLFDDYHHVNTQYANRVTYSLVFGQRAGPDAEAGIQSLASLNGELLQAMNSTGFLLELLPWLRSLPESISSWKRMGNQLHQRIMQVYSEEIDKAAKRMGWSLTKEVLNYPETLNLFQRSLVFLVFELVEASVLTTPAQMNHLLMTAADFPMHFRQMQLELDKVVGTNRLPSFHDFDQLPYVRAFILETLRWRPLGPFDVPHSLNQDDEYQGYSIPRGSYILINNRSIRWDGDVFEDPHSFSPQRWIDNPRLPVLSFGMGRRACPGQVTAVNNLYILLSRIVWAFDLNRVNVDTAADPLFHKTVRTMDYPTPFGISFRVRSPRHREVVEREWTDSLWRTDFLLTRISESFR